MAWLMQRVEAAKERGRRLVDHWRVRRAWIDHLIRTFRRYQGRYGDRLAGAITYFAFLSFFPLVALAYGLFVKVAAASPGLTKAFDQAMNEQLPGIAGQLQLDQISQYATTISVVGLIGLLYAGLGAVDALRGALREMSMSLSQPLNFFLGKARDLVSLVLMGLTMLASVVVSGFANQATTWLTGFLGLDGGDLLSRGAVWSTGVLAGVVADWTLFLIVLGWVARPTQPFGVIARGALLGAVGFGLLKLLAGLILGHTLTNPIYGTFAVMVGLLLWINFSARLVLYVAAWTATAGMGPPPSPTPLPGSWS
ncbi:YihY/virulence factor BrkB family protein [Nonomuraea sp. NPDC050536]|uniref:YihY/virulence factor BrkB family protein n=1 Tax=Nonomuraea sp. NPDC050536 TaxID=3364366 RepID=UPI0037C5C772